MCYLTCVWDDTPRPRSEKPQQDGRRWNSSCAVLEWLWGDNPYSRAKEKPQQDGRRGEITFRNKPHTRHRCSEGSNKTLCTPEDPTETESDLPLCVWVSPEEVRVSSGLLQGQGLWVQQTWVWYKPSWRRSPLNPHQSSTFRKRRSWHPVPPLHGK